MAHKVEGRATIRSAAVIFLASAVVDVINFSSAVAIFGGVRTGAVPVVYASMKPLHYPFDTL
jgi:hypothetical protein